MSEITMAYLVFFGIVVADVAILVKILRLDYRRKVFAKEIAKIRSVIPGRSWDSFDDQRNGPAR